jgi:D-3-phosphoglycerate dehydrogenase / 2-oxoglutarate reductase
VRHYMGLAEKIGLFAGQLISDEPIKKVDIEYCGDIAQKDVSPLKLALIKGLLNFVEAGQVNYVNAEIIAKERGIVFAEAKSEESGLYKNLIHVKVTTEKSTCEVGGTYFEDIGDMIVSINGMKVNVIPEGHLLVVPNDDKPGIIGKIGTLLGKNKINIASMLVGRETKGGNAVMVVALDQAVGAPVISEIEKVPEIRGKVKLVTF